MSSETSGPREESFDALTDDCLIDFQASEGDSALPPPPVISAPRSYSSNPAGHLLVTGTCMEGAYVEVLTNKGKLGDAVVVNDRFFLYRVWGGQPPVTSSLLVNEWYGWLGVGADVLTIGVRQYVDGLPSNLAQAKAVQIGVQDAADSTGLPSAEYANTEVEMSNRGAVDQPSKGATDDALELAAPTLDSPVDGTVYRWGENPRSWGTCLDDPMIRVSAQWGSVSGSAPASGGRWSSQLNIVWTIYPKVIAVTAWQFRLGTTSPKAPTAHCYFELSPPEISFPPAESEQPAGGIYMSGICDLNATVKILASDDVVLGNAQVLGHTWVYFREWTPGPKHVKAVQIYKGITTRASDVRMFTVR
ncbi:hypothetical protein [Pseudomonas laurylsulfatiphila]|uniref:hypothetical protein n=1 Tax=Pseudomonas laurylsulfatiphila TaxID=2011015 RepID=UPI003D1F6187